MFAHRPDVFASPITVMPAPAAAIRLLLPHFGESDGQRSETTSTALSAGVVGEWPDFFCAHWKVTLFLFFNQKMHKDHPEEVRPRYMGA